jgi:hypothetical protein
LTSDGHIPQSEDPGIGTCRHDWIGAPSQSSNELKEHESSVFQDLGYKGNLGALVGSATKHGRPAIFTDGALTPLVISLAASKSFSTSIDVISTHDMTLAGDASFNSGIFLVAAAVDRALKGSMAGERMNNSFGREVSEKELS